MSDIREGGCACGALRYRVRAAPVYTGVCHCTFCQRRTGSAFGVNVYFRKEDFELTRGALKVYEHRSDESNRWFRMEFCPSCATTVTWTLEVQPGWRGVAAGTLDETGWLRIDRHGWARSKQQWVTIPGGVEVYEKSALIAPLSPRRG